MPELIIQVGSLVSELVLLDAELLTLESRLYCREGSLDYICRDLRHLLRCQDVDKICP